MRPNSARLPIIDAAQRRLDRIQAIYRDHAAADGPRRPLPDRTRSILTGMLAELAADAEVLWRRRFADASITLEE